METGERYTCTNSGCNCEIEVTRGAQASAGSDQNPRCCCGREMQRSSRERERVA